MPMPMGNGNPAFSTMKHYKEQPMDAEKVIFEVRAWVDAHKRAALAIACIVVGLIIGAVVF